MNEISYFDSHAHLCDSAFAHDVPALLQRAWEVGVRSILAMCTTPQELDAARALSHPQVWVRPAAATHPHEATSPSDAAFTHFERAAREGALAAVGETGFDAHYAHSPKELQRLYTMRYLHLAAEVKLPVIFHCREAFSDLFALVDAEYPKGAPAVLHCFTGTMQEAEEVLKRGWYLSISGIATFKKSEALRTLLKEVPLSQLLLETDAPYLAPQSRRGKRNEPSFLPETAACVAAVKGLSLHEVARATRENGERLFFAKGDASMRPL